MTGAPVRVAAVADTAVVAQLLDDFNREFDTPTPGAEVLAGRLHGLLARDDLVVLLAGEPAVALALLTFRPGVWYPGPVTMLEELYVQPGRRGGGIGTAVLERAVALARDRGSGAFQIEVDEGDVDARRFYERHGFANTEPGQTERFLHYWREL